MNTSLASLLPVNLYLCELSQPIGEDTKQALRQWLPQDERNKVDRYLQPKAREKALLVRCYLRALLSEVDARQQADASLAIKPDAWRFDYLEKGKPVLASDCAKRAGLIFNLSHSGDYLLLAITQGTDALALGVDIERKRQNTNIHAILNHYFTPQETQALLALPEHQQRDRFFDLWALKESYIKAKGMGLALSLKSFYFELASMQSQTLSFVGREPQTAGIAQSVSLFLQGDEGLGITAGQWQSWLGQLEREYRFALSIKTEREITWHCHSVGIQQLLLSC